MYIGAVIGFFSYKLAAKTMYFWNYVFCLTWYYMISILTLGKLPRVALEEPIEIVVEKWRERHPKLEMREWTYTGLPEDVSVEARRKKYDGVVLKGGKDSVSSL